MESIIHLLRCPLCGGAFSLKEKSLVCEKRHTYDIAKQGYVNFVPGQKEMFYKKELFESRAKVFDARCPDGGRVCIHGEVVEED